MAINYAPNYGMPYPYNNGTWGNGSNNYSQMQMFSNGQNTQQLNDNSMMVVFVQGESGANAYPVASGNTVLLMDFESGKFWIKSNVNGIPQRLRSFSFAEEIEGQTQAQQTSTVSRDEFNKLADSVHRLIEELGGTKNE